MMYLMGIFMNNPLKTGQSSVPAQKTSPSANSNWFIFINGQKKGPLTTAALNQLIAQGLTAPDTYIMREGDTEPRPLREFSSVISQVQVPIKNGPSRHSEKPKKFRPEWWSRHYFDFHKRGDLPWLFTVVVNTLLPLPFMFILLYWLGHQLDFGSYGRWVALFCVLIVLGLADIFIWQWVGVYRSLAKSQLKNREKYSKIASIVMFIFVLWGLWLIALPTWNWIRIAAGFDPQGRYQISAYSDKNILRLNGAIGYGLTNKIRSALDQDPKIRILQLELDGGRVAEAQRLAALIRQRKLVTYVEHQCSGPCTTAFIAGERRLIGPNAKLAFYRYVDPRSGKYSLPIQQNADNSFFESQGVLLPITLKMFLANPDEPWIPSHKLLIEARAVHLIAENNELQLALNSPLQFDLLHHPVMRMLKVRDPDQYRTLANGLQQKVNMHVSTNETIDGLLIPLETFVRQNTHKAANAPLQEYVRSLIAIASDVKEKDPDLCYRTLFSIGTERELGQYLTPYDIYQHRMRASAMVLSSYDSPAPTVDIPGRGMRVFRQALYKKLGDDALLMGTSDAHILSKDRRCEIAIGYYENALRMPSEYRYDMLRNIFN